MTDSWHRTAVALSRTFTFASFADAMAFVNRLADYAERVDHHPDLDIRYRKVTVTWTTHDVGTLTARDEAGAAETDRLATDGTTRSPTLQSRLALTRPPTTGPPRASNRAEAQA
jgi:4a-hydroxytetrahydrobiopterin dehydratase